MVTAVTHTIETIFVIPKLGDKRLPRYLLVILSFNKRVVIYILDAVM